ncbi:hypothetical protein C8Q80DRAFT_1124539 [Daedaleopsis nitida]|nr:hypothetical protein C8Q80DRAFT_1124539 [Daedaleopsis nitida]
MAALLFQNARIIGLWLQLFAFGVYTVYLKRYAMILYRKRHEGNLSVWLPAVCLLMFGTTIMVLVFNTLHGYRALSVPDAHQRPNPTLVYADVSSATTVTRNAATVALAIISDFIMVYRTFIVWNRKILAIVVPSGFLLADIGLSQLLPGADSMICWKIWRVHSRIPPRAFGMGHNPTAPALYCAHLLVLVVSDRARSNLFFVFLDALPPVTALVFTVLIVRTRTPQDEKAPTSILAPTRFEQPLGNTGLHREALEDRARGGCDCGRGEV